MKISNFLPYQKKIWNPLELENMQLNNSSIALKHVSRNSLHDLPSVLAVYVHLISFWCKNKN